MPTIHQAHLSCLNTDTNLVRQRPFLALFQVEFLVGVQHNAGIHVVNGQQSVVAGAFVLPMSEQNL